jgi:hypothetical protein
MREPLAVLTGSEQVRPQIIIVGDRQPLHT